MWPEFEALVQSYYTMMDDFNGHPDWQKKLENDLGNQIAFMVNMLHPDALSSLVDSNRYFK